MTEKGIGYFGTFLMSLTAVQVATCGSHFSQRDIKNSLKEARTEIQYIRENVQRSQNPAMDSNDSLDFRVENVLGGPEPESFYVIDGNRLYVTVDGKPAESYFPLQAEKGMK